MEFRWIYEEVDPGSIESEILTTMVREAELFCVVVSS